MKEITINEYNTLEETLKNNTKRIFNFVRKNKQCIVHINKHEFFAEYRRKGFLGDPTVNLCRILDKTDKLISASLSAIYQIVRISKNSYKIL